MNSKRILIVHIESLLIGAAESVLQTNGSFSVIHVDASDLSTLIREIERVQPGVILMDEDTYSFGPGDLFRSLSNIANIRLIVLNNRRIAASIYEKCERVISNPQELIHAIQANPNMFDTD